MRRIQQFNASAMLRAALLAGMVGLGVVSAAAQYAVDPRVNPQVGAMPRQDGRLLDANPSLNAGRVNLGRPAAPLIGGNPFATGNVGRGLSLRINSPIESPLSFQAPLGSGALSTFRRDSVSVFDTSAPLGSGALAQPYYDPATTAYTSGLLQGGIIPSQVIAPRARGITGLEARGLLSNEQWGRYNTRNIAPRPIGAEPVYRPTMTTPGVVNSSLFGPQAEVPRLLLPEDQTPGAEQPWRETPMTGSEMIRAQRGTPRQEETQREQRMTGRTAVDSLLRGDTGLIRPEVEGVERLDWRIDQDRALGLRPEPAIVMPPPDPALVAQPRVTDPSVLPGYDVFNDMRLALALQANPGAAWFAEMERAAKAQPEMVRQPAEEAGRSSREHLQELLKSPLKSLTGGGSSALNELMLKAEAAMQMGHYTEAADRYDDARAIAPGNPLPLIGKGHALLAAGAYSSAAEALIRGFSLFPDVARFTFDLRSLMGSGEQIDVRRADLMRRLDTRETAALRFLLGYLEYHTGDRERGLANLRRAASQNASGSFISQYPSILVGEGAVPAPQTPPGEPERRTVPGTAPGRVPSPDEDVPETLVLPPRE